MLKVISLALLFLIRIRFPWGKSITHILRSRYGNIVVKEIWISIQNFKGIQCLEKSIIPTFLHFRVSNSYLKPSNAYTSCQLRLLKEEISLKQQKIITLEKEFNNKKLKLRNTLGIIDFTHVVCLFQSKNDKNLKHHQEIQSKKLFNLAIEKSKT